MAEHAAVIRIIRFKPAAGKRDELVSFLLNGAEQVRKMEGCYGVSICAVREAPDEVTSVSRWASQAALDEFLRVSEPERPGLNALASAPPVVEHFTPL